ncbi:MAG: hypothetical protein JWL81_3198 [Verrucomicrobiales bacterium]|nr:hypothetical protein [Verrucomicrobiales bacterium]
MRRFQNFLPSAALACLATLAWAQDPIANPAPGPATPDTAAATAAPEDIAAKAMAAMDALNAPAEKTEKPDKTKASDNSGKPDKSSAKKAKPVPPGTPSSGTSKTASKSTSTDPASPAAAAADDDNDDTPGGPDIIPPPPEDGRGMDMMSRSRMDMMVPPGRSHRGVHYPMYRALEGDRGEVDPALAGAGTVGSITAPLESLFESEIVTRLDNDHIQFDRAKWVQFDEVINPDGTPKPSMSLEIERGVYDMKNDILMTNQPVRIENKQFLIEGDTMLHDRASGLTRLTGRVRMTFFNQDPEPPADATAPAAPKPADSPAATPTSPGAPPKE